MDRIITQIRDSKFIVADFTKNRGGVYYEAGVAFGLGIDVVNVCDADCLKDGAADRLHFDVRHLVFVTWDKANVAKFSEELCSHIVAIHGRGPRATSGI
jgi:nucleoside 2-deoxyribosyltransferase